jgi:hypothetical protein
MYTATEYDSQHMIRLHNQFCRRPMSHHNDRTTARIALGLILLLMPHSVNAQDLNLCRSAIVHLYCWARVPFACFDDQIAEKGILKT